MKFWASQGDAKSQYELGVYYENKKEISEACKWFEAAAEQHHNESQFLLGFYCRKGDENYPANLEMARFWLTQAAESNHIKAQRHLGNLLMSEQKKEEAAVWYAKAAANGDEQAMLILAMFIEDRAIKGYSMDTALEYYAKLAQPPYDNKEAMVRSGLLYCKGEHIKRNAAKGKKLLEGCMEYIETDYFYSFRVGMAYCTGEVNPNKEPTLKDLDIGMKLLSVALGNGLNRKMPEAAELASMVFGQAKKRKESLTEVAKRTAAVGAETDRNIKRHCDGLEESIAGVERILFRDDAFSESKVKEDLQIRKNMEDLIATRIQLTGSPPPGAYGGMDLSEKKQYYRNTFGEWRDPLERAKAQLQELQNDHPQNKHTPPLISRLDKCIGQIDRLLAIVRQF